MRLVSLTLAGLLCTAARAEDADLVRTLAAGLRHHESSVPPLTGSFAAVWDYAPEYLARLRELGLLRADARSERAAVALSLFATSDNSWEVEAQALVRGHNPVVPPILAAPPEQVSDLYRLTVADGQSIVTLSRANLAPMLSGTSFTPEAAANSMWGQLRECLGLWLDEAPSALVEMCLGPDPAAELLSIEEMPDGPFRLRLALSDPRLNRYTVSTFVVDADGFYLREFRWVVVSEKDGRSFGTGTHISWGEFEPLPGGDVRLPRRVLKWRIHHDDQGGTMRAYTQQVRACRLVATEHGPSGLARPRWLSVGARLDPEALQNLPDLAAAYGEGFGALRSPETEAFVAEEAPSVPPDLVDEVRQAVAAYKPGA